MNQKLQNTIIGIVVVSVLGTIFHFVYDWSGQNAFVGLWVPVNESTWEHMKLVYFPMLIFILLDSKLTSKIQVPRENLNMFTAILATFLVPILFYTYTGILGTHYSVLDIATFYISVTAAFVLRYRIMTHKTCFTKLWDGREKPYPLLAIGFIFLGVCFFVFTYHPPKWGIFQVRQEETMTQSYLPQF